MIKLYTLKCPKTLKIRYVGVTVNRLEVRLSNHKSEARTNKRNNHRLNWIRSLLAEEKEPVVELLGYFPQKDWEYWEKHFISLFRRLGYPLVNSNEGGNGNHDPHYRKGIKYKKWDSDQLSMTQRLRRMRTFRYFFVGYTKRPKFRSFTELSDKQQRKRMRKFRAFFTRRVQ